MSNPDATPGWKLRFEDRLNLLDPITVLVFRSYGTPDAVHLRGRVTERKGVQGTTEETTVWRNILNTLQRLDSDEVPGARIRAHLQGRTWDAVTDHEGFFAFDLDPVEPLEPGWHNVSLELVETPGEPLERFVEEPVLIPSPDAEFAVVSDLDDTVVHSHATEFLEMVKIIFREGADSRTPFPGVPALYRALHRGPDEVESNPLFYVSRTGWNLYDLFEEFLDLNDIPRGPLFLSDLRLIEDPSSVMGEDRHKFDSIETLLRTYRELPFILIGDSGQHDPELYREIAEKYPGRIRAIYIHDVSPDRRDEEVEEIARKLKEQGIPMLRIENAADAAEHAAGQGYISRAALEEVKRETQEMRERA